MRSTLGSPAAAVPVFALNDDGVALAIPLRSSPSGFFGHRPRKSEYFQVSNTYMRFFTASKEGKKKNFFTEWYYHTESNLSNLKRVII